MGDRRLRYLELCSANTNDFFFLQKSKEKKRGGKKAAFVVLDDVIYIRSMSIHLCPRYVASFCVSRTLRQGGQTRGRCLLTLDYPDKE